MEAMLLIKTCMAWEKAVVSLITAGAVIPTKTPAAAKGRTIPGCSKRQIWRSMATPNMRPLIKGIKTSLIPQMTTEPKRPTRTALRSFFSCRQNMAVVVVALKRTCTGWKIWNNPADASGNRASSKKKATKLKIPTIIRPKAELKMVYGRWARSSSRICVSFFIGHSPLFFYSCALRAEHNRAWALAELFQYRREVQSRKPRIFFDLPPVTQGGEFRVHRQAAQKSQPRLSGLFFSPSRAKQVNSGFAVWALHITHIFYQP